MGENTTISTLPKVSNTNGTELLKTHIARRKATDGPIADYTLCGRLWDRAHPTSGEMCQECLAIYKAERPGWHLPR
jgi:hypothetical protein